ncbi:MAG TPA: hypothetical protein VF120_00915, partial [Ktedonobacterales bacterium]
MVHGRSPYATGEHSARFRRSWPGISGIFCRQRSLRMLALRPLSRADARHGARADASLIHEAHW